MTYNKIKLRKERKKILSTSTLYTPCKRINEGTCCREIQLSEASKSCVRVSLYYKFLDKLKEVIMHIYSIITLTIC